MNTYRRLNIEIFALHQRTRAFRYAASIGALGLALGFSGCALESTATSSHDLIDTAATIHGTVHGGRQPVAGSTITLWAIGSTGYGSQAIQRGQTITDSSGNFAFGSGTAINTCVAGDTLYVTASGGDPGNGTDNPAAVFLSLAGACAASKTATLNLNEVSTVAAMFALTQYFNPVTESFGRGSTAAGLSNALSTANLLANFASGSANQSLTTGPTNTVTITPEYAKLNTIANLLAACVNSANTASSASNACTTLFSNATPPPSAAVTALGSSASFPAATDILVAAYYLAVNPINASAPGVANSARAQALYNLVGPVSPFQPVVSATPSDWTLGIAYSANFQVGTGSNIAYTMSGTTNPQIDGGGNIIYINQPGSQYQSWTKILGGTGAYSNYGPSSLTFSPLGGGLAVDLQNHIFYVPTIATGNGVYASGVTALYTPKFNTNNIPVAALVADGTTAASAPITENLLITDPTNGNLYEIPNGTASNTNLAVTAINSSSLSLTGAGPNGLAIDQAGHAWIAETGANSIVRLAYPTANEPVRMTSATAFRNPIALAVDHANNLWVANQPGVSDDGFLTYALSDESNAYADNVNHDGGINNPVSIAVDGAGNAWVANAGQTVSGSNYVGQAVSELSFNGSMIVPLSPSGTSGGFQHEYNGVSGIAVDQSGNVWITNKGAIASATTKGLLFEIVGAAVPVVNSLSAAIKAGTLGTKP